MQSPNSNSRGSGVSLRNVLQTSATALILGVAIGLPEAAAQVVTPPPVPDNLEVQEGETPYLIAHASGTQNYLCTLSASGFTWTFLGPQATLFDDGGQQVTTHFLSTNAAEGGVPRPTWQHSSDTSAVWAAPIASSSDPNFVVPGAIPWLLLRVVGVQSGPTSGATLAETTSIQRVNTGGGIAPVLGCKSAHDVGRRALVPYTADYVFYK